MSDDLLLPATAGMLEGWCGPVVIDGRPHSHAGVLDGVLIALANGLACVRLTDVGWEWDVPIERVRLNLSRAECRDRVARMVSGRSCHGVLRRIGGKRFIQRHEIGVGDRWFVSGRSGLYQDKQEIVPALADIDPDDHTGLPDGSRLVDALALTAVARHLLVQP